MLNWDYQDWVPSDRLVPRAPEPEYYELTEADGISGDDVNRHLRERRLGYAQPSEDWSKCNQEIRCIWPNQLMTKPFTLTGEMHVHNYGWYHGLKIYQGAVIS